MIRLALLLLLLIPGVVDAAVSISEVAWMGSTASANAEWIELHNDGTSVVNVDGWVLSDGMNLSITLSGSLSAGDYVVLERTSDETVSGTAFLIYTGALVNTGATLSLIDATGWVVDRVAGGENWEQIGGDNVTKETSQYTSKGWVTAVATPQSPPPLQSTPVVNDEDGEDKEVDESTQSTTRSNKKTSSETVRLTLPDVTLQLAIDAQSLGYVNQPLLMRVTPSGIGETLIDSLSYEWNFGDGMVSDSKEPTHMYAFPGTYVVTLRAHFARQEQVTRHEVTILPVQFSITKNAAGDVQLNNDSPYEVDISGYRLRGSELFTFPPYSIILPNETITIHRKKVEGTPGVMVALYDQMGVLVASTVSPRDNIEKESTVAEEVSSPTPRMSAISTSKTVIAANRSENFGFASAEPAVAEESKPVIASPRIVATSSSLGAAVAGATAAPYTFSWPYVALVAMLGLGMVGIIARGRSN